MKTRNGFVSNSSSSSFLINKKFMNDETKNGLIEIIKNVDSGFSKPHLMEANSYYRISQWLVIDKTITDFIKEKIPEEETETAHGYLGSNPTFSEKETRII